MPSLSSQVSWKAVAAPEHPSGSTLGTVFAAARKAFWIPPLLAIPVIPANGQGSE